MLKSSNTRSRKRQRTMVLAVIATLFFVGPASTAYSQSATTKPAVAKKGKSEESSAKAGSSIEIGQTFPALKLKDQSGDTFDMTATLKQRPVALVIFRSADW
jgi:hypothetical protein